MWTFGNSPESQDENPVFIPFEEIIEEFSDDQSLRKIEEDQSYTGGNGFNMKLSRCDTIQSKSPSLVKLSKCDSVESKSPSLKSFFSEMQYRESISPLRKIDSVNLSPSEHKISF